MAMTAVDGASRVAPEQVKQRTHAVSKRLLQSFASSFGPRGRAHVVQANQQCADALTITSSASRYLHSVRSVMHKDSDKSGGMRTDVALTVGLGIARLQTR